MRIISQDGEYDFPYEISTVRMCVGNDDKHYWIAVNSNCIDSYWNFAVYSSKQKAEKAMEMLRGKYKDYAKATNKSNFFTMFDYPKVFQFPQDEDVEV